MVAGVVGAALGVVVAARLVAASVEVEFGEVVFVLVFGVVVAARLVAASVEVESGKAVFGEETLRFGVAVATAASRRRRAPPSRRRRCRRS